jgi:hypothetical protein
MAAKDVIRVATDVSGKLIVQAKGHPANVVAYGAAAAIAFVGVAVGYGTLEGARWLVRRQRDRPLPPNTQRMPVARNTSLAEPVGSDRDPTGAP